jgi:hypothetical protein
MLNRLTIGTKIAAAFGLITVMVLVLGLTCLNRMSAVNDRAIDVRDNWLPSVGTMGLLLHAVDRTRLNDARRMSRISISTRHWCRACALPTNLPLIAARTTRD